MTHLVGDGGEKKVGPTLMVEVRILLRELPDKDSIWVRQAGENQQLL